MFGRLLMDVWCRKTKSDITFSNLENACIMLLAKNKWRVLTCVLNNQVGAQHSVDAVDFIK